MEIILLIAGGLIFVLSFFIPDAKGSGDRRQTLSEDELNALLAKELTAVRGHVERLVQEAVGEAMETTERFLEKLSNEKIMAVSEYSDTVLSEIHKNHEEVIFLYDMLNNKHTSLKNAMGEINQTVQNAEKAAESLEKLVTEAGNAEMQPPVSLFTDYFAQSETDMQISGAAEGGGEDSQTELLDRADETENGGDSCEQERNKNVRILELYRQGKSVVDVARELNLGVGEVKLVVDLFRSR